LTAAKIIIPFAGYHGVDPTDVDTIAANAKQLVRRESNSHPIWSSEVNAGHFVGPNYAIVAHDGMQIPVLVRTDLLKRLSHEKGLRIAIPT
jgi:hypothetical protein